MTSQMLTVLWIAAVGSSLLFIALSGLVGLMYLLTAPWTFRRKRHPRGTGQAVASSSHDQAEYDRRRRAAAMAVAIACADGDQVNAIAADESSGWRLIHRARRLGQSRIRRKSRS